MTCLWWTEEEDDEEKLYAGFSSLQLAEDPGDNEGERSSTTAVSHLTAEVRARETLRIVK